MLYFISWLTDFAALLFVFTGTRFLAERGASALMLGWLGASFFLASAISNACSGRIADVVGRRRVALCGTLLFLASLGLVAATHPASWLFYVAYTGVGISLGMIYPSVIAWLGHGRSGQAASRAYLFFCLAFNLPTRFTYNFRKTYLSQNSSYPYFYFIAFFCVWDKQNKAFFLCNSIPLFSYSFYFYIYFISNLYWSKTSSKTFPFHIYLHLKLIFYPLRLHSREQLRL